VAVLSDFGEYGFFLCGFGYFPIQNLEKIESSRYSVPISSVNGVYPPNMMRTNKQVRQDRMFRVYNIKEQTPWSTQDTDKVPKI